MTPETEQTRLIDRLKEVNAACQEIIKEALHHPLPVAGNIAVFCQSETEYEVFKQVAESIANPSDNPAQKYLELKKPLVFSYKDTDSTYNFLYVRAPAADSPEAGDVDFVLNQAEYTELKRRVSQAGVAGASVYERPGWDMVEIRNPRINALPYVCTQEMAEKVRVRF